MERGISMTQMLICRLTHYPGHKTATVVLEDIDRRLELAVLIPVKWAGRLARVLGLARCPCVRWWASFDFISTRACFVWCWMKTEPGYPPRSTSERPMTKQPCLVIRPMPWRWPNEPDTPIFATDELLQHARPLGQARSRGIGHADGVFPAQTKLANGQAQRLRHELNIYRWVLL